MGVAEVLGTVKDSSARWCGPRSNTAWCALTGSGPEAGSRGRTGTGKRGRRQRRCWGDGTPRGERVDGVSPCRGTACCTTDGEDLREPSMPVLSGLARLLAQAWPGPRGDAWTARGNRPTVLTEDRSNRSKPFSMGSTRIRSPAGEGCRLWDGVTFPAGGRCPFWLYGRTSPISPGQPGPPGRHPPNPCPAGPPCRGAVQGRPVEPLDRPTLSPDLCPEPAGTGATPALVRRRP